MFAYGFNYLNLYKTNIADVARLTRILLPCHLARSGMESDNRVAGLTALVRGDIANHSRKKQNGAAQLSLRRSLSAYGQQPAFACYESV
jgi:hypothetical protein